MTRWTFLAALGLCLATSQVWSDEATTTYNPASCSTDADHKVYVRLYPAGVAFGFPYRSVRWMDGRAVEDRGPIPLPDDPEGCPGNPIVTRAVSFDYGYQALKADRTNPQLGWRPDQLKIFGRALGGPHAANTRLFQRRCEHYGEIEELRPNFTACRARTLSWVTLITVIA